MAYGYSKGFVIKYVDRGPVSDKPKPPKASCKLCVHADMSDKSCTLKGTVFTEEGYGNWKYCSDYCTSRKQLKEKKRGKNTEKTSKSQSISKSIKKNQELLKSVEFNNKVEILKNFETDMKCKCGNKLEPIGQIQLFYLKKGQPTPIHVGGKYCFKCSRAYVLESVLLRKLSEQSD